MPESRTAVPPRRSGADGPAGSVLAGESGDRRGCARNAVTVPEPESRRFRLPRWRAPARPIPGRGQSRSAARGRPGPEPGGPVPTPAPPARRGRTSANFCRLSFSRLRATIQPARGSSKTPQGSAASPRTWATTSPSAVSISCPILVRSVVILSASPVRFRYQPRQRRYVRHGQIVAIRLRVGRRHVDGSGRGALRRLLVLGVPSTAAPERCCRSPRPRRVPPLVAPEMAAHGRRGPRFAAMIPASSSAGSLLAPPSLDPRLPTTARRCTDACWRSSPSAPWFTFDV